MGKLIDPERTKKAKQAREERASRILEAAEAAFIRFPFSEITLDTIGCFVHHARASWAGFSPRFPASSSCPLSATG